MMEVTCDNCGTKYRIDENKIKEESVRTKCKSCDTIMIISKPKADSEWLDRPDMSFDTSPGDSLPAVDEEELKELDEEEAPSADIKKVRFGLRLKMIVLLMLVSLIPLGFFWGISFKENSDRVRQDAENLMAQTTEGLAGEVDEWIDKNVRVLKAAARLPEIMSMNRSLQEPALKAIGAEYPWMYLVFTVGPEGMNTARNDGKPLVSYADRDYYKSVMQGNSLAWQTLVGRTNNLPALVIAVPIKSTENTIVGVMAAAMTIEDISKRVVNWKKGKTGYAFMVDEKSKVVAHQINEYVVKEKKLNDHPLVQAFQQKKGSTSAEFQNEKGKSTVGYIRPTKYGWALAIQQEQSEVFEALQRMQRFALILLAITVVLVFLIALYSAGRISRPIMNLREAAERMSLGDLNVEINPHSKDEIGALAESIDRMQTSMRLAIDRLRQRR